jgi:hypothetical protein
MTRKEHQHNISQVKKTIDECNAMLRGSGIQINNSQSQIKADQINVQSPKLGRGKIETRPRATNQSYISRLKAKCEILRHTNQYERMNIITASQLLTVGFASLMTAQCPGGR